jgi:hypothetical protein
MIPASVITKLYKLRLSDEQLDVVVACIEEAAAAVEIKAASAIEARRSSDRQRKQRQRGGTVSRDITGQHVTSQEVLGQNVTDCDPPPPPALPPVPPNPPTPAPVYKPRQPSAVAPTDHPRFAEFLSAYPKRNGSEPRKDASIRFTRLVSAGIEPDLMIAGAKGYARSVRDNNPKFTMQMVRFLNGNFWEQYGPKGERQTALFSDAGSSADPIVDFGGGLRWPESRVKAQLAAYRDNPRSWMDMIGPPPGQPGCRIPKHLLEQARAA